MQKGRVLVIRADASAKIGMGHVMRCMAIAEEWTKLGGRAIFLSQEMPERLQTDLKTKGIGSEGLQASGSLADDAKATGEAVRAWRSDWLIVDGDKFDSAYFRAIREGGQRLLIMDDNVNQPWYEANAVTNQSVWASGATYAGRVPAETAVLAGPEYALLRPELRISHQPEAATVEAKKVLICLGGSDPINRTSEMVRELAALKDPRVADLEFRIIVGSANPFGTEVRAEVERTGLPAVVEEGKFDLTVCLHWADTVLCAAGVFSLEVLHHRLPMGLTTVADNQNQNYPAICGRQAALPLGAGAEFGGELTRRNLGRLFFDAQARAEMFVASEGLVDGAGAERVARHMMAELPN